MAQPRPQLLRYLYESINVHLHSHWLCAPVDFMGAVLANPKSCRKRPFYSVNVRRNRRYDRIIRIVTAATKIKLIYKDTRRHLNNIEMLYIWQLIYRLLMHMITAVLTVFKF